MKDPTLSQQQRRELCDDITNQDVWSGLQAMEDDKALGIDGCNSHFFKHDWPILKDEIIGKIMAVRIQEVIPSIIYDAQATFITGRKISDNIILAHELVKDYGRKNASPEYMVNIDLQKAYDSVELPYLKQVMSELGFPD
uniref:Reverse transcriptase domain-containing protein n=1 Tax=Nicotiana tabacum TaxID=4097 RepID=A0A1S3YDL1_TOBAC|nr:PREDICTED: uncharacterized protein LOC107774930 [Nicotiana tabacum]